MSKKRRQTKICGSKKRYETKSEAYYVMHKVLKNNFVFHKLNVYKCPICGYWHYGHSNKVMYGQFDKLRK